MSTPELAARGGLDIASDITGTLPPVLKKNASRI